MASNADIANLALSHLAVSTEINDLATERSKEAQACRRFYEPARDEVLRKGYWPFATVIEDLALVETEPNQEWAYSYRYPADAMTVRRLLSGTRNDTRQTLVPYRIIRDDDGQLILTDVENAIVEYTYKETNPERFSPDFVNALSLYLAHKIGPRVAGGDQFKLSDRAFQLYTLAIAEAKATALNEEKSDDSAPSEFESSR